MSLFDRDVGAAGDAERRHAGVQLVPVLGLGLRHPVLLHRAPVGRLHRLDLDHVLGLRRLEEAGADGVDLAAQPAAGEREALLLARDLDPGAPEIGEHTLLLDVAALEDPELAPGGRLRRRRPAQGQPDLAVAGRAQRRGADAVALVGRARVGRGLGLAGAPDRVDGRLGGGREGDHQAASPDGAAHAHGPRLVAGAPAAAAAAAPGELGAAPVAGL